MNGCRCRNSRHPGPYRSYSGPRPACCEETIANAPDDLFPLTPVTEAPAEQVRSAWSALLTGQDVPLIGEDPGYDDEPEERYR